MTNNLETLLQSWINMELSIRGNRVLSDFSFNEVVVCHLLLRYQKEGEPLTATELGEQMHLLKSQMNHLLTSMEQKGLIRRTRSESDHRKISISLCEKGKNMYEKEHRRILKILSNISEEMGEEQFLELAGLMHTATNIAERKINENK